MISLNVSLTIWIHTSCARLRAHTLNRSYSQRTVLRAYTRVCGRTYAEEFNLVELSRPALISQPIKCVCEGHAQPTDIDPMVICTRIRAYVHTYNSQRICAAQYWPSALPSVAHTRVYARWWSQKVWIQLKSALIRVIAWCQVIIWSNVDQCVWRHATLPSHNELFNYGFVPSLKLTHASICWMKWVIRQV